MSLLEMIPAASAAESALTLASSNTQNTVNAISATLAGPASTRAASKAGTHAAALPDAVASLNNFVQASAPSIQFLIDNTTGQPIVKVMDIQTHQLLFQLPSGKALEVARNLDQLPGLLLNQKA